MILDGLKLKNSLRNYDRYCYKWLKFKLDRNVLMEKNNSKLGLNQSNINRKKKDVDRIRTPFKLGHQ